MSPNTRPNNKDKHPRRVDLSPQRRTQTQKRSDDAKSAEEKQAQEEVRQAGIRQLAEVEERTTQRLRALLASGAGPRAVDKKAPKGKQGAQDNGPAAKMSQRGATTVQEDGACEYLDT
jgi:hypothetical protein